MIGMIGSSRFNWNKTRSKNEYKLAEMYHVETSAKLHNLTFKLNFYTKLLLKINQTH